MRDNVVEILLEEGTRDGFHGINWSWSALGAFAGAIDSFLNNDPARFPERFYVTALTMFINHLQGEDMPRPPAGRKPA